jgi:hypothetical protein
MRILCALLAVVVVLATAGCARWLGSDVRLGPPAPFWTDTQAGPDHVQSEPLIRR